jgi:hypothetical protein
MDSKLLKESRLADLSLRTELICAAVKDIKGASIDAGNVVLDLSLFGPLAVVVLARSGAEIATVTQTAGVTATLDFAAANTTASIIEVYVKLDL